jgi:hypothetical protein
LEKLLFISNGCPLAGAGGFGCSNAHQIHSAVPRCSYAVALQVVGFTVELQQAGGTPSFQVPSLKVCWWLWESAAVFAG